MADSGTLSIRLALEGGDQVKSQLQQIGTEGEASLKRVGDAGDQASAKLDRAFSRLAQQLDPGIRAQAQLERGSNTLNAALSAGLTTQSEHARLMDLLRSRWTEGAAAIEISRREIISFARALATGNFGEGATALARMGASASSLTGGMLALTAAALAIPGIFIAAAIRMGEADAAALKFETTIRGLGGVLGGTGAQVQKFAADVAKIGPFSEADTEKAAAALLKFRGVSIDAFEEILPLAKDLAAVTGEALPASAERLAQAYTGSFEAIRKLDNELGLLTPKQLEEVRALEEQNRLSEAARIVFDALEGRVKGLSDDSMTPLAKATKELGVAWRGLLDSLDSSGAVAVVANLLERIAKAIDWLSQHENVLDLLSGKTGLKLLNPGASDLQPLHGPSPLIHRLPGGGVQMALPPAPLDIPLRNEPAGLAGGPSQADLDARTKATKDFVLALDDQAKALNLSNAAFGQTDAAALRLKLTTEALSKNILTDEVQKHIDAAVAAQEHADALKKAAEAQKQFDDALKSAKQTTTQLGIDNQGLQGLAATSAISPAAEAQQRRLEEAFADTQAARDAALGDPQKLAEVDKLTAEIQRQLEVRDQLNQTIRANDEDRKLQQTLELKQRELALMGQDAGLRAQELADLKLRNELIEDGYEIGSKAFDDEYQKRKLIADQIAATTVAIKRQQEEEKKNQEAMKQFASEIGSALERWATATGSAHKRLKDLEQTLAQVVEKELIFKPFEANFQGVLTGQPVQNTGISGMITRWLTGGGSGSAASGGLFGWLFGSSASSSAAAAVSSDSGQGSGTAGSSGSGILGWLFGSSAPSASSATGSGGSSSGGLLGWLFGAGSGSSASALSNATINVASATINARGAGGLGGSSSGGGGLFGGLGSFFSDLFGGGSSDVIGGAAAAADPASFFGFAGLGFAKGGIFDRARRFAAGGVVQDPTYFNIGLMGESGPESIMPLTRMAGGQLGVRSAGGGGHSFYIDARGSGDPREVEATVERVMARHVPGIVRLATSSAVDATFGEVRRGGRARQITGGTR